MDTKITEKRDNADRKPTRTREQSQESREVITAEDLGMPKNYRDNEDCIDCD